MLKKITDLDVEGKKVLVRIDLNLPRKDGVILDYTRIERSLKTLNYLIEKGAKIIIISHLGRPKGVYSTDLSLAPIADSLEKYLNKKVGFASDIFAGNLIEKTNKLKSGEILLLENLRFYKGEEKNDKDFVQRLASLADIYINDTFSCSHRAHASTYGITEVLPSAAGFLLIEELESLEKILKKPKSPILAIIGGSKVSTKLELLKSLIQKVDYLAIGGAMANSFLKALNIEIGSSSFEAELLEDALEILELAKKNNCQIILPEDFIVSETLASAKRANIFKKNEKFEGSIFDIGPSTLKLIENAIEASSTIIWNGPLGAFETEPFDISSKQIARIIAYRTKYNGLVSVAGGGDTLAAIKATGLSSSFTYISTGGGAFLDWLKGQELPGLMKLGISLAKPAETLLP